VNYGRGMNRLAKMSLLLVAAAAGLALDSAPASASPETRDHRAQPAPLAPSGTVRYRRRPGPRIMMPLKVDIGAQGAYSTRGFLPGIEGSVGIHWASLSPTPTDFDIGLGVFGAALVGPEQQPMAGADDSMDNDVLYGGAYLEVGHTLSQGSFWRTWASGRGEYLGTSAFGKESVGIGATGRLSAELFLSGVGIEPRGVFLGTYAVGVYAEASARGLGDDVGMFQVSGGLTFRTPLVFGF